MIPRDTQLATLNRALARAPVTALLGPRQCGKTTLAQVIRRERRAHYLDLEAPADLARLQNPQLFLESLEGLVILDEVQRVPALFPVLRVLADQAGKAGRFLVLGSASPSLVRQASESLAGRIEFIEMGGFTLEEAGTASIDELWLRGGFPRSFLAAKDEDSYAWRENFIRAFLQGDIPQLGISIPAPALRRFWSMLAHYHAQTWNASVLGRALGLSDKTVRRYLDILTDTYMIRQLPPWHENIGKRQVRSPKVYFRDSGLFHALISIPDRSTLWAHPKIGASWEGFMVEQVLNRIPARNAYFWATHGGAEIDLLVMANGRRYGVEFKWSEKPALTRSLAAAEKDLSLAHTWIVCPGKHAYRLEKEVTVISPRHLPDLFAAVSPASPG